MSLTTYSDLNPERINAREAWLRCPHSRSHLSSKDNRNSKDLKAVGALFSQLGPIKRPDILEITDDEGPSRGSESPSKRLKIMSGSRLDSNDSPFPVTTPPSPLLTPTQAGAYLPPNEVRELKRQRSDSQRRESRDGM